MDIQNTPTLIFTNNLGNDELDEPVTRFIRAAHLASVNNDGSYRPEGFPVMRREYYTAMEHENAITTPHIHFFLQHSSIGDDGKPKLLLANNNGDTIPRPGSSLYRTNPDDVLVVFFMCNGGKIPKKFLEVVYLRPNLEMFWQVFKGYHFVVRMGVDLKQQFVHDFLDALQSSPLSDLTGTLVGCCAKYYVEILKNRDNSPHPLTPSKPLLINSHSRGCCCGLDMETLSTGDSKSVNPKTFPPKEDGPKAVSWQENDGGIKTVDVQLLNEWLKASLKDATFVLVPIHTDEGPAYKLCVDGEDYVKIHDATISKTKDTEATMFSFYPTYSERKHLWNDQKHQEIVARVFSEIEAHSFAKFTTAKQRVAKLWNKSKPSITTGLLEADTKAAYNNHGCFSNHFYNPVTKGNYWFADPPLNSPVLTAAWALYGNKETALTSAIKHSAAALDASEDVGYHIGLTLHYLTDLSQPMHSSDFPNFATDWRHSAFEKAADPVGVHKEVVVNEGEVQELVESAKKAGRFEEQVTYIVHGLATKTHDLFTQEIKPKLANNGEWYWGKNINFNSVSNRGILKKALTYGITYATALLLLWGEHSKFE